MVHDHSPSTGEAPDHLQIVLFNFLNIQKLEWLAGKAEYYTILNDIRINHDAVGEK